MCETINLLSLAAKQVSKRSILLLRFLKIEVSQHAAQQEEYIAAQGGAAVSSTGVGIVMPTVEGKTALPSAGLHSIH
ncbi:hypothetical protein SUGI_0624690 [Cryptomeria japonica]|nr:hypothetical protein SUGI_0624690 [Cryptomeria japonica]